jgi:hypothetical protein
MPDHTTTGVGWYCCASLERADLDARGIAETEAGKPALEFGEFLQVCPLVELAGLLCDQNGCRVGALEPAWKPTRRSRRGASRRHPSRARCAVNRDIEFDRECYLTACLRTRGDAHPDGAIESLGT